MSDYGDGAQLDQLIANAINVLGIISSPEKRYRLDSFLRLIHDKKWIADDTVANWLNVEVESIRSNLREQPLYAYGVDYQVARQIPSDQQEGVPPVDTLWISVHGFKLLCLNSTAPNADIVKMYYIDFVDLYNEKFLQHADNRIQWDRDHGRYPRY